MTKLNMKRAIALFEVEMEENAAIALDEKACIAEEIERCYAEYEESSQDVKMEQACAWENHDLQAELDYYGQMMDQMMAEADDEQAIEEFYASEEAEEPVLEEVHSKRNGAYRRKQDRRAKRKLKDKAKCAQLSYHKRAEHDMLGVVCIHGQKVWGESSQTMRADELWKRAAKQKLVQAIPA